MLVQASALASIRADDLASIRAGVSAPQAPVMRAHMRRAARILAMENRTSVSTDSPNTTRSKASATSTPARTSALT